VVAVLDELAVRTQPLVLARDEQLPVLEPLAALFPGGSLRRGTTVTVGGAATSLMLALLAGPSQAGSWTAVVGHPDLGLVAAAEFGVVLDRLALVPWPGSQWTTVVSALLDAVDVVVVRPPAGSGRVRPGDARRLMAKARERGAVLMPVGGWVEGADVRLAVASSAWEGLGDGHGHLRARRVEVVVSGRGAANRHRQVALWLPDHEGEVSVGMVPPRPLAPTLEDREEVSA
jgi:hypothetical protein